MRARGVDLLHIKRLFDIVYYCVLKQLIQAVFSSRDQAMHVAASKCEAILQDLCLFSLW